MGEELNQDVAGTMLLELNTLDLGAVSDMCIKTDGQQTHYSSYYGYTGDGNGIVSCP
jgi:hypothetical protein